jgi:iron complex outermembrane receptor protein
LRRLAQRLLRMRSRHRPPSPSRSQAPGQPPATTLDRIGVTGSNIRRTDTETASPVQVVTRQEIERTGKATVAEYLQTLTSDGSGSVPKTFGAGFASGSAAISLRGPGAGSTLVLPNGRRKAPFGLADDGQKVFTDPSTIPMEAVERVGVRKDGASSCPAPRRGWPGCRAPPPERGTRAGHLYRHGQHHRAGLFGLRR